MPEKNPKTPKEPKKEIPTGTGPDGKPVETPPTDEALTPEEKTELGEYRKIKKETGFTKFSESAKEAIKLSKDNKNLKEKLEQSGATLSEKDLKKMNPDYENMIDEEKEAFRTKVAMQRRMAILEAKEKMRNDYAALPEEMREKIKAKGGFEKFKDYACSSENAGQKNLLNIAKAFLFEEKPAAPPAPVEPEPKPGLEPGGGGAPVEEPKKEGEMTAEESAKLRTENPKEYARLIKEKKLKIVSSK